MRIPSGVVRLTFLISISWFALPGPLVRSQSAPSVASTDIMIQRRVPMYTRDGVTLYADIYRPKSSEKYPVILMRTPYDKSVVWAVSPAFKIVARGYILIIQDVRGRYTSEGEWYPFKHEQADGYDSVEWAASLPYSNGKVGMMGGSYVGATQMLARHRCASASPGHRARGDSQ